MLEDIISLFYFYHITTPVEKTFTLSTPDKYFYFDKTGVSSDLHHSGAWNSKASWVDDQLTNSPNVTVRRHSVVVMNQLACMSNIKNTDCSKLCPCWADCQRVTWFPSKHLKISRGNEMSCWFCFTLFHITTGTKSMCKIYVFTWLFFLFKIIAVILPKGRPNCTTSPSEISAGKLPMKSTLLGGALLVSTLACIVIQQFQDPG